MNIRHTAFSGIIALAVSSLAGGGDASADQNNTPDGTASTACYSTHNFSSGANTMNICFSDHGNLMQFTSPASVEHLRIGAFFEGYILNDISGGLGYYDVGGSESGFGAPVIAQPNGANTFPLTITRTTSDGNLTLKQVFSWVTANKIVKITMTVTNNTLVNRAINLTRFFDGDIGGTTSGDYYSKTNDSVTAWEDGVTHQGLLLFSQSLTTAHSTLVDTCCTAYPIPAGVATPTTTGDYTGFLTHNLVVNKGKSKTVTVAYRRI